MPANNVIVGCSHLKPGWYGIGFEDDDGHINWNTAPICRYLGDGLWEDDDGNAVDAFWDPVLQLYVATDAPDAFLPQ